MKKLLALVCVLSLFSGIFAGCKSREDDAVKALYKQFIAGEVASKDKDGNQKSFLDYWETDLEYLDYRYTFIDMTDDGVAELCVQQIPYMHFFTISKGEIRHWYTEDSMYSNLLNNGAFLFERHGAAPTHINYEYYELDKNAQEKFQIEFSWWDGKTVEEGKVYPDTYFIGEEEVSEEEYKSKTKKYLEIGNDKIVWYGMEGKKENHSVLDEESDTNITQTESLSEKLIREIDGAYDEEMKSPEDSSTAGMCAISEKYTKKWQAVADEYYNKLMQCDIKKTNETSYYTTQEFHTFIKNMKTSWEKDHAIQCENYKKTLYAIYGGTIVNTLYADYVYNEQMEWALKLVGIYEQL